MPQVNVSVGVDFTNVVMQGGSLVGTPNWTVSPDPLEVHNGNNNITWTLTVSNLPQGCSAAFDPSNPIVFKSNNSQQWVGSAPAVQRDGTVTAGDNFQGLTAAVNFYYSINLAVSITTSQAFSKDPDIENEP